MDSFKVRIVKVVLKHRPDKTWSNREIKKFYNRILGYVPWNWRDRPVARLRQING